VTCSIFPPAQVFAELQDIELPSAAIHCPTSQPRWLVPTDVGMMIDTAPISGIRPHRMIPW